jgi:integrase
LEREAKEIKILTCLIGDLPLHSIHMGALQGYIEERRKRGNRTRTINYGLQVVRRILNLATQEWIDEYGLTWLAQAPHIKLLKEDDRQPPYPLSWEEQERLIGELPDHVRKMALFKVNTGCRDQEVCNLRWQWEVEIPELNTSVFIIPKSRVKNREDRLVVLNRVARAVIEEVRGRHEEFVFTYRGKPIQRMYNHAWMNACARAGLKGLRVHDLKHTFGRRLRAAGVSFEDRQDLLGHKSGRITTHYSAPELLNLIQAAERACGGQGHKMDTMVILRQKPHLAAAS